MISVFSGSAVDQNLCEKAVDENDGAALKAFSLKVCWCHNMCQGQVSNSVSYQNNGEGAHERYSCTNVIFLEKCHKHALERMKPLFFRRQRCSLRHSSSV